MTRDNDKPIGHPVPDRLLRLEQVMDIVGLKKTMIYRLIRKGEFPQPYKPGGFASRWSEAEVIAWREQVKQGGSLAA